MGCDIHLYVEKRVNGKWKPVDKWFHDKDDENPKRLRIDWTKEFYGGRNYNLFSILADVRNGYGFAGCKTGGGFVPISKPRGIPDDACPEYKQECEGWGGDGHSHSYFTVAELMEYDWTQTSNLEGVVDALTFDKWERWGRKAGNSPESYAGDVSGSLVRHVSEDEMRKLVKKSVNAAEKLPTYPEREAFLKSTLENVYTRVKWTQSYYQCATEFLSSTMPRLWRLGKPEDVRIVFFFDN